MVEREERREIMTKKLWGKRRERKKNEKEGKWGGKIIKMRVGIMGT